MPLKTGDQSLDTLLNRQLTALAERNIAQHGLASSEISIRDSIFHDFSQYEFVLPPSKTGSERPPSTYPGGQVLAPADGVGMATWSRFESFVDSFGTHVQAAIATWLGTDVVKFVEVQGPYVQTLPMSGAQWDQVRQNVQFSAEEGFRYGMAPSIFEIYVATSRKPEMLLAAHAAVRRWLETQLSDLTGTSGTLVLNQVDTIQSTKFWKDGVQTLAGQLNEFAADQGDPDDEDEFGEDLPSSYPWKPFRKGTINFGLQVVFRQSWSPLGTQPGEIVRTIPLGPRQTEKVSVKAITRTKSTRQSEIVESIETATESSAATKDSSEVVQEASDTFNWHVEASASASFGFGGGSVKAGAGGESSSASKDTKSVLNETMEKTASKIKRDTKIVVSNEVEESSEFSQVSEITNPNDEIAVTYVYSRLQRQYEVQTYLSEVNRVVFVAEEVPAPADITGPWIRRYDWILSRELLDESFRNDLSRVRSYSGGNDDSNVIDDRIRRLMESLSGDGSGSAPGIPKPTLHGEMPNVYEYPQAAYEREIERSREKRLAKEAYLQSLYRLRAHIYDNVLHYCRAIWRSEDPESRLLRYRDINVPIKWEFVATSANADSTDGYFTPSVTNSATDVAPLSELVNPAGPIGFAANYAVFYLRESATWRTLSEMVGLAQAPYLAYDLRIDSSGLSGGTVRGAVSDAVAGTMSLRCAFATNADGARELRVLRLEPDGTWVQVRTVPVSDGRPVVFLGVKLWLDSIAGANDGEEFSIALTSQQILEDPELKALRWSLDPLDPSGAAKFYTAPVVNAMRDFFADVNAAYAGAARGVDWNGSSAAQRAVLLQRFYDYVLRSRHTRRILLDTSNVLLTREVDDATSLEPFKAIHRVLDVLAAGEEVNLDMLENARREARLSQNKLGDPDVEKVTVVATSPSLAALAALDGLTPDPDDGDGGGDGGDSD